MIEAGVRIFFYLEDRERTLDTPTDKIMLSLTAFADELEREKARQRTRDAMVRKAKAGHVTGGKVFGYENVDVLSEEIDSNGRRKRSHVELRVKETEAAVVLRIFELCAAGKGLRVISKILNGEGAACARSTKGWAPSAVRVVLYRRLYAGEIVWGQTVKRNRSGGRSQTRKPASEWVRTPAEHLRIVPEELWEAAHARLTQTRRAYLSSTKGRLWGRPDTGLDSKYLLTGLGQCSCCGGSLYVRSHASNRGTRRYFYSCQNYQLRGTRACTNRMTVPMDALNAHVLATLEEDVLQPRVVLAAVQQAIATLRPPDDEREAKKGAIEAELRTVEAEIGRYVEAIATAGPISALLSAIQERDRRRQALRDQLALVNEVDALSEIDERRLAQEIEKYLREHWQGLLERHVAHARQLLRKVLASRIQVGSEKPGTYRFFGEAKVGKVLTGVLPKSLASPTGSDNGGANRLVFPIQLFVLTA